MKRLPLLSSLIAVVALSASLAYWALQLFKPVQRPISAAPLQAMPEAPPDAAAGLFGGQAVSSVAASNYQLRGVIASGNGRGSVAILSVDGKPATALPVGAEVAQGVTVRQVQPRFVLLAEGGVVKRIDLLVEGVKPGDAAAVAATVPALQMQMPAPAQPQPAPQPAAPPPVRMGGAQPALVPDQTR